MITVWRYMRHNNTPMYFIWFETEDTYSVAKFYYWLGRYVKRKDLYLIIDIQNRLFPAKRTRGYKKLATYKSDGRLTIPHLATLVIKKIKKEDERLSS